MHESCTRAGASPLGEILAESERSSHVRRGRSGTTIGVILGLIALGLGVWALVRGVGDQGEAAGGGRAALAPESEGGVRTRGRSGGEVADAGVSAGPGAPSPEGEPAAEPTPTRLFARAPWGSGRGELGRTQPDEANPEGPMSLAEGPDGAVVVLDQVNRRLVRFGPDGQERGSTPVSLEAPQDLALGRDGSTAVLDRLVDRRVAILGPDGREVGSLPVEGEGIPEPGGVTAVVVDGEDVYLERENGMLVRVGDMQGRAADRGEVPGRPTRDGLSYVLAGLIDPAEGRFFVNSIARANRQHRFTRDLAVPLVLRRIVLLDTDLAGVIYVAVMGNPYGAPDEVEEGRLLCLSPADGTTLGMSALPPNAGPEETMRELIVLGQGGVLYSLRSEEGVSMSLFDCR